MAVIKVKRGFEVDRTSITPSDGELILARDTQKLYFGDGTTAGGIAIKGDSEHPTISAASDTGTLTGAAVIASLTFDDMGHVTGFTTRNLATADIDGLSTALAGKVDDTDSRLTNARDWTASTVTKVEAEAGTSTVRRAWTAQRVAQAAAAWWGASADKAKLDDITPADISNWDAAYSWGNHAGLYASASHNHSGVYEPVFSKNTAFNKNFGTTSGTVAQGNDSRINNGQTAFGWGDHGIAGYAMEAITFTAGTGLTGGGSLAANRTINVDVATAANLQAGTANKIVDAAGIYSANAPVTSSGSGSWAPNFNAGRVFDRTLTGGSTLANPTNLKAGQTGHIYIVQDATGGRTLATDSYWKTIGGEAPAIDETANAVNVFSYYVRSTSYISLRYLGVES